MEPNPLSVGQQSAKPVSNHTVCFIVPNLLCNETPTYLSHKTNYKEVLEMGSVFSTVKIIPQKNTIFHRNE